jgi:chromosome segregation ATPase
MARSASALSGMRDIRTMSGTRKGSIPHMRESLYLRLYMLRMENDRLSQEYASVEKRRLSLKRRLEDIRNEIARLERSNTADAGTAALTTPRCPGRTSVSTMPVRY